MSASSDSYDLSGFQTVCPLFRLLPHLFELDTPQSIAERIRLDILRAVQDPLPIPQFLDVRLDRNAVALLRVLNIKDADLCPFAGVPVGNVHAGIQADALKVYSVVEGDHRLLH